MKDSDLKFDNDYDNIIADTVRHLYESTDILSNELSDELLINLWIKTNLRDVSLDNDFLAELIFNVYTCYKTIKGFYVYDIKTDWSGDLSESEFRSIVITWNILIGIELLRRDSKIKAEPFKILDFDEMENIKMQIKIDETAWQSLFN